MLLSYIHRKKLLTIHKKNANFPKLKMADRSRDKDVRLRNWIVDISIRSWRFRNAQLGFAVGKIEKE